MQVHKNRTSAFSIRADLRTVAAIYRYYKDNGIDLRSRGSIINFALEDFLTILVNNEMAERIEILEEAEEDSRV